MPYFFLQAIRAGHLYLSSGPHLELTAEAANGQSAMMGDALNGLAAHITARWAGCSAGQRLHLVMDGEPLVQLPVLGEGSHTQSLHGQTAAWCAAELRTDDGELLALTNPIFFRAA